jgi:5-formyltetrahydrofolate cyclo-ligase
MDKNIVRSDIWEKLLLVAYPDSRFHFDFSSFIADFQGSAEAQARLTALDSYRHAQVIFITPDNCLEGLRWQALQDGKRLLVTSYAIKRGFFDLDPAKIASADYHYAATLDGMERVGKRLTLAELHAFRTVDLLVTGAAATSLEGVRSGKGHGFFDLEWAIFYELGMVTPGTPVVSFVHDCQVVDIPIEASAFDTVCDLIVTPTRVLPVAKPQKPTAGILWDQLQPDMLATIPPLQELQAMQKGG